ncbi:GAF domain-containing protein [Fretibacter rubidus]|uniref:GAF domain-containing protein n=1 Tax=Fretibacter rubidus TaxID=570162 RepID=UPI00352B3F3F
MSEHTRIEALHATQLLDSVGEERFDRLTRLAKNALQTDMALISLIDTDRQWFKSKQGLDVTETPRDIAFCDHAIREDDVMVVNNAAADSRFADNPLVTGDPSISFYAGVPLVTQSGQALGTLCVLDKKPRADFSADDKQMLKDLAASVMTEIESAQQLQMIKDLNVINEELRHRMGNMYAHVSALISMMGRNEADKDMLVRRLREKITTLGQTQALLASHKWASVPMSELVDTTLSPFLTQQSRPRVHLDYAQDFDVSPRGAFILTLMLSELGTNAVKHGALSRPDGELTIHWDVKDEISLSWTEDVPVDTTNEPGKGFGSQILKRIVPMDLQGQADYALTDTGLHYSVTAKPERLALINTADLTYVNETTSKAV